jgi:hypothetical protein
VVTSSLYIFLPSSILPTSCEASRPPSSGLRGCEATVLEITATMLVSRPVSPHVPHLVIHQHVDDVGRSPMERMNRFTGAWWLELYDYFRGQSGRW